MCVWFRSGFVIAFVAVSISANTCFEAEDFCVLRYRSDFFSVRIFIVARIKYLLCFILSMMLFDFTAISILTYNFHADK